MELAGRTYETDGAGFLIDAGTWSEELAAHIARADGVELTPPHWQVIDFVRGYYEEFRIAPAIRVLTKAMARKLGPERGNIAYLNELFPKGPALQACKIAGLPKPTGCV